MAKEVKYLYQTKINRVVEKPEIEIKEENGQKIEVKRQKKSLEAVPIALLKPDRKLHKGAEIFYAKSLAEYLRQGLMPYSLVAKRYANDGGPLNESDKKSLEELEEQSRVIEKEFYAIAGDENPELKDKKNDLLIKLNEINTKIGNIRNVYANIFDSSAEIKARDLTIEWWMLHLLYINLDGKGYAPIFPDSDYEKKLEQLEELENKNEPFLTEAVRKLYYLVNFWFAARTAVTVVDFLTMEKLYDDTQTTYKAELPVEEVKVAEAAPVV